MVRTLTATNKMNILLLVDYYLPGTKSSAQLIHDLAAEFHLQGHKVIIVAPDSTLAGPLETSFEAGITVLRVRTGRLKEISKVIRAINEARLSSVIWKAGKDFFRANRCDLIVFYSPTIFFGKLVQKLKKLWNCKAYLILRDIFPQWAVDIGVLKEGPVCQFFRHKERQQYKVADIIGVQSPGNLEYFTHRGLENKYKLEVLYNWISINGKKGVCQNDRAILGLQDKIVFIYGGNIGIAQEMDNIVHLAMSMRDHSNIHFLLVGEGSEVPRLKAKIQENRLNNISIHPPVPQERYFGMLSESDVGLISLNRKLTTHNFPGKMLGYMYSSMPILASVNPGNDLKQLLEESGAGFVCLSGEYDKFCNYALQLATNAQLRRQMGRNASSILEKTFCVTRAASQILSHLKEQPT